MEGTSVEAPPTRPTDRYIRLTIGNYRCFPSSHPVVFLLRPGFTSFIGANNAGKSTLLRFLYEFRDLLTRVASELPNVLRPGTASGFNFPAEITDPNEVASRLEEGGVWFRIESVGYGEGTQPDNAADSLVLRVARGVNNYSAELYVSGHRVSFGPDGIAVPRAGLFHQGTTQVDAERLLSAVRSLQNSLYVGPFRNAVNVGALSNYYDLQIGQAFITQWRQLQTGNDRAANEATERLVESIREVFGFERLSIQATANNENLVLLINGASRRLNEVGAGLAQFVVCLANVAVRHPDWVCIDEPEMNLHPRLQSQFLRSLGSFAGEGVIFATHTLGLARSHAEQIYSFRLIRDGESHVGPYARTPRLAEFLGELGYESLREVGFDRLLLVEGPSDLLAVKELLRKFGKEAKTVVFHLGGGDRSESVAEAELAEVTQITERVSVLLDSERSSPGQPLSPSRKTIVDACAAAAVPILVLERRAFENYLSDRAVKATFGSKYSALGPFEQLGTGSPSWSKRDNWRVAAAMTAAELADTDLGQFLEHL